MVLTEQNKSLVRRFLLELYNKGNYDLADELVAPDYTSHNELNVEVLGPEGIKRAAQSQRTAFPDLVTSIDDLIAEDDKVVVRGHDEGTHLGTFMGLSATGRRFAITWIDIFRIHNGKLAEAWLEMNVEGFRKQLGDR